MCWYRDTIGLAIRWGTGLHTIEFPTSAAPQFVVWTLDALAIGIGILLVIRILDALARLAYPDHEY